MTLSALSKEGNRTIRFRSSRATTEEGQSYENKFLKMRALKLPVGQKVQIKLDMGSLSAKVNKLATVELQGKSTPRPAVGTLNPQWSFNFRLYLNPPARFQRTRCRAAQDCRQNRLANLVTSAPLSKGF